MKKIVIEIVDDDYNRINSYLGGKTFYPVTARLYKAVKDGTPIPNNATNDDVLKALFDERGYMGIHDRMMHTKWLSAPYQKGGK